jgi:hypothetical protein
MLEINESMLQIRTNEEALEVPQNGYVIVSGISVEEVRITAKYSHQSFEPEIYRVNCSAGWTNSMKQYSS